MDSQCDQILRALKQGQHLTPLQALERFGCFRLGARIHNLKERGWDIAKVWVEAKGKRFASYYLVGNTGGV
jgi:hypothetical protein